MNDIAIMYMKRRECTTAIQLLQEALQRYADNTESLTTSVAFVLVFGTNGGHNGNTSLSNMDHDALRYYSESIQHTRLRTSDRFTIKKMKWTLWFKN